MLSWIVPPGLLWLMLTRYTTEGLPPKLAQGLAANGATQFF